MATADLQDELSCSICLSIYTDPVMLPCGHNFCRGCIGGVLDAQGGSGGYSCPECRAEYRERPALPRNRTLGNIAERFLSAQLEPVETQILCTYCDSPVDLVCVCASCCLTGEHRGHRVEPLSEASEKKDMEERAASETERVTALFRGIRGELEALEKRLLNEISRQKELIFLQLRDLIRQLEIQKGKLSRKIRHTEELCNMADPLAVLQEWEDERALDVGQISETLLTGLAGIVTGVKGGIYGQEATDMLFDINTANNYLTVSGDRKSVSSTTKNQNYPLTAQKFIKYAQALSSRSFPSGRHYWEVEGSESGDWGVGVAYPSIEREGDPSRVGFNKKSWCLTRLSDEYLVVHNHKTMGTDHLVTSQRIRVFLDYEAGRLSFYELSEPIRHLHTFTATFTEPLHAVFSIYKNSWVRICS
uniref:Uncharacterized protein n=1 Tax=Xenopus tropicalis TaxID=8364 RepID=F6U2T2_XENTR